MGLYQRSLCPVSGRMATVSSLPGSIIPIAPAAVTRTRTLAGHPPTALLHADEHALYVPQPTLARLALLAAKTGKTLCTATLPGQPSLLPLTLDSTLP